MEEHSQDSRVNGSGPQQNQKCEYISVAHKTNMIQEMPMQSVNYKSGFLLEDLHVEPSEEQLVRLVGSQMCAKWNMFSLYLGVQKHVRDEVSHNSQRMAKGCFVEVVGRWLSNDDGTGDSPRTWETVCSALEDIGHAPLAEEVKQKLFQSGALTTVTALEGKTQPCTTTYRSL